MERSYGRIGAINLLKVKGHESEIASAFKKLFESWKKKITSK